MQIAITGHTSGIGKALYDNLKVDNEVIGFARTTDRDINYPSRILKECKDCDIFINNAYDGWAQIDLLYALVYHKFKGKIISIGSISADNIKHNIFPYAIHKGTLDDANAQLYHMGMKVTCIRPGYIDTPRVNHRTDIRKLDVKYVVEAVNWVISRPHRVKDITLSV
ncbi:MAG: hypothetical protein CMD98_06400 [Gammaproteobacteria bacterium]|nr:hypothetical protein [Gammaproteobacteria bacterium]